MTQKPTEGRIVHYFPGQDDSLTNRNGADKLPAIIIQPFTSRCNLYIFSVGSESPVRWSIPQKDDVQEGFSYWDWPEIAPVMNIAHSEGYKPTTDGGSGDITYKAFTEENRA